jgi:hypothetical protein
MLLTAKYHQYKYKSQDAQQCLRKQQVVFCGAICMKDSSLCRVELDTIPKRSYVSLPFNFHFASKMFCHR